MFKGGGDGAGENQTIVLASMKRQCALLEKTADCAQLSIDPRYFKATPKEKNFQNCVILSPRLNQNIFPLAWEWGKYYLGGHEKPRNGEWQTNFLTESAGSQRCSVVPLEYLQWRVHKRESRHGQLYLATVF